MDFITNNILLIVVAFLSGAMLLWPALRRSAGGPSISANEATQLMNREHAVLLDVREQDEFDRGHVPQAKHVPLEKLAADPSLAGKKDKPVILMCATGARSAKAAIALRKAGYEKVYNLDGGLNGWTTAGLPTVKSAA